VSGRYPITGETLDSNVTVAIISASSTTLVAIVALLINSQRFNDMSKRIDRVENKLDHIEQLLVGYALDMARVKEKLGIT